jgi:hypothetical protein
MGVLRAESLPPKLRQVLESDGRQKKDLFLNVRSEIEQLHDLR